MVVAHLHRIDADANMARFYCIYLAATLFGEVTVLRRWGRIGTCGRTSLETWPSAGEAATCGFREIGAAISRDRGRLFHGIAGSHFAVAGRLIDGFMGSGVRAKVKGFRGFSAHAFA